MWSCRAVLGLLLFSLECGWPPLASAADVPRLVVTRPVPVAIQNALESVRRTASLQEWSACAARIDELQILAGDTLVPMAPDHFVNVSLAVDLILSDAIRRQQLSSLPVAMQGRKSALFNPDELLRRGDAAWEQGDLARARQLWNTLLVPRKPMQIASPLSTVASAELLSRLCLLNQLESRPRSAQDFLRRVEEAAAAQGRLAGKSGLAADLLRNELAGAAKWPTASPSNDPLDWPSTVAADLSLIRRCGHIPCERNTTVHPLGSASIEVRCQLVSPQGVRLLINAGGATAQSQPIEYLFPGHIPDGSDEVPQCAFAGDSLYVCLGPQVLNQGHGENQRLDSPVLACLKLSDNLLPLWQRTGEQIMEQPGWIISSAPVVQGEMLTVALRSGDRLGAAQMDRQTGEVLWRRTYGELPVPAAQPRYGRDRLLLSAANSDDVVDEHPAASIVMILPEGECLGLSAGSGRQLWSRGFASYPTESSSLTSSACIDSGQLFLITPQGACACVSLVEGAILWQEKSSMLSSSQVLGVCDDLVLLAGGQLRAVRRFDGASVWSTAPLQSGRLASGAAVMFGHQVLWSTSDRLWLLDALTGSALKSWPQAMLGTRSGKVQVQRDRLLLPSDDGWDCFEARIQVLAP